MMSRNSSKQIILGKQLGLLPIFTALFCYFCIDSIAQVQPKATTVQQNNEMDTYYAGVLVNVTDKRRNISFSKKYEAMTLEERNRYLSISPNKMFTKNRPTKAQWEEFKNNKKYAIWINNLPVANSTLAKYPLDKIVRFGGSLVAKGERSKKFPQPYKYYFYTEDYFKITQINESNKFPGKIINIHVSATEKSLEKKLRAAADKGITYTASTKLPTAIATTESAPAVPSNEVVFNAAGITEKPDFPGGMEKFYEFVGENYKAPTDFKGNGKIYLLFIVEKDGSITNSRILRDVGYGTGEEALRVIKLSPKWIPAKKDGVPVRVQYSLPITLQQG